MTGFGCADFTVQSIPIHLEIRSVNHRFCDVVTRNFRLFSPVENRVARLLRERVQRGRVEVSLSYSSNSVSRGIGFRREVAEQVVESLLELSRGVRGVKREEVVPLSIVAGFREIFQVEEEPQTEESLWPEFQAGFETALAQYLESRQVEGSALASALRGSLQSLAASAVKVRESIPATRERLQLKLQERIRELLQAAGFPESQIDQGRLLQEVAMQADRSDIEEELQRLDAHLNQFEAILGSGGGGKGRRLEFLLQEMHREVNTMGSKATDIGVTQAVLDAKSELERLREQIQNVE